MAIDVDENKGPMVGTIDLDTGRRDVYPLGTVLNSHRDKIRDLEQKIESLSREVDDLKKRISEKLSTKEP